MIRLENLSKSFADKVILDRISYHFPEGERIALIGANGQGKTTLLNIMTNREESDSGQIIKPKALRLGFLPQSPNPEPESGLLEECLAGHSILQHIQKQMDLLLERMGQDYHENDYLAYERLLGEFENENGYQIEGLGKKILKGLGFSEAQFDQSPLTLSGGWRMRLELARTLIAQPTFLILDEPTNHLDLPSIEWLETYLLDFKGTLIFVSHDQAFLNNLGTTILYLNNGQLTPFKGNFDDFIEQKDQAKQTQEATLKNIAKQQAHVQKFIDRFRAKASKAKQVTSRVKMIDRLQSMVNGMPQNENPATLHIPPLPFPKTGRDVLSVIDLSAGYARPLVRKLSMIIRRGEKIAIVGANGMGKSTLLKTFAQVIPPLEGTISHGHNVQMGYFSQEAAETLDGGLLVFETLTQAAPKLNDQSCRAMLGAFLFKGNDLTKPVKVLSGGERSRLALCCQLAQLPNFLLLDEPTNHLDLASVQVLAHTLQQFAGSVIFVSHDRSFVEQSATKIIELTDKGTVNIIERED